MSFARADEVVVYEEDNYFVTDGLDKPHLFRYTVWLGNDYPYNKFLDVFASQWGARWYIRRHQKWKTAILTKYKR